MVYTSKIGNVVSLSIFLVIAIGATFKKVYPVGVYFHPPYNYYYLLFNIIILNSIIHLIFK